MTEHQWERLLDRSSLVFDAAVWLLAVALKGCFAIFDFIKGLR